MSDTADRAAELGRITRALERHVDERMYFNAADEIENLADLLAVYTPPNGAALCMLLASLHDRIPRHRQSARDHLRSAIEMVPL